MMQDISKTTATNTREFGLGVMPVAELSCALSQLARERATQPNAKEFAGLEADEAEIVVSLLKGLGIPSADGNGQTAEVLRQFQETPAGAEFDRAYIAAELTNHQRLYDFAGNYLKQPVDESDAAEMAGRRLATLAQFAFKEHVVLSKCIAKELA